MQNEEMITISLKAEPIVVEKLDEMVKSEDTDRSKLIRKLIRQEYDRRFPEAISAETADCNG